MRVGMLGESASVCRCANRFRALRRKRAQLFGYVLSILRYQDFPPGS